MSDGCNQYSFALAYVVFESFYRSINAILNSGKSPNSFFSSYKQSVCVASGMHGLMHSHEFSRFLFNLFKFFSGQLQEWFRISYENDSSGIFFFIRSYNIVWFGVAFLFSPFLQDSSEYSNQAVWFRFFLRFPVTSVTFLNPSGPIIISMTITFVFHYFFFSSQSRSKYWFIFLLSFSLWSVGIAKSKKGQVFIIIIILLLAIFFFFFGQR